MIPYYFSHGRTALKYGLLSLGLKPGDEILIPDYICDVVLHPLKSLGLKHQFYPVLDDLSPNWDELEKIVRVNSIAILMVHYFGQPQNIPVFQNFCKIHKLFLIEDNAHGHGGEFEGQMLGTFGDMGMSSPRKHLNTYCGGILWLLNEQPQAIPKFSDFPISLRQKLQQYLFARFPRLKNCLKRILKQRPPFENFLAFKEKEMNDYGIDIYSKHCLEKTDWNVLKTKKQKAYKSWQNFALGQGLAPIFKTLHSETNPWCFPAYVKDQKEAIRWFEWGWENDVQIYSWPSLPEEVIDEDSSALERWKRIICISTNDSTPEWFCK